MRKCYSDTIRVVSSRYKSFVLVVIPTFCGASEVVISKIALEVVSPTGVLFIRTVLSTVIFTVNIIFLGGAAITLFGAYLASS
jgi:hypothetical protein